MPLTMTDAVQITRTMFGEVEAAAFANQQIVDWLSLGQQVVAALTLGLQRHQTYRNTDSPPLWIAGLREYVLDGPLGSGGMALSTAIRPVHIYLNGQDLPLWTAKMIRQADPTARQGGTPQYWYVFGKSVGFVPYPDAAFVATSWTCDVMYADLPGVWSGGPSLLSHGLDELPTYYAVSRLCLARRQWQRASQMYNQFLLFLQAYRQRALFRSHTSLDELWQPPQHSRQDTPRVATERELRAIQGGRR